MARTYEIAFKVGATMATNFAKIMGSASGALGELNNRMDALGKQKSANQKVLELRDGLAKSSKEFKEAQQRAAQLAAEIARTEKPTKSMQREFDKAQAAVQKSRDKMQQQAATLREVSKEAGATGKSTAQLVAEQNRLATAGERAAKAQAALQRNVAAQQANKARRSELRGQMMDAVALGATLAAPIKVAMDFEAAMSQVGAVSRASNDDLALLTKTARELGASTQFSASQAAEGMNYLGMAGFTTSEIIASMPSMLDLAAASKVDLATTSDIASDMLSGFRLEASEMQRVADVMTNAFTSGNTDLVKLGETMKYIAPLAVEAGSSIEQVSAMAVLLGDNAIKSGQAGTSLRSILNRLSGPPTEAAKALAQLGIETKDAEGNLRDIPTILTEISEASANLGSADKLAIFKSIAGAEAGTAFAVLVDKASKGELQELQQAVGETGAAQRVAAKMTDNARGALIQFNSAVEAINITVGNVLLPVIADLAKRMSGAMLQFEAFADANPNIIKAVVLTTAGLIAFKVAAIAGGYAFTFVKGAVLAVRGAYLSAKTALLLYNGAMQVTSKTSKSAVAVSKLMTAAQWLFNAALTANPIGLVIVAIAGLIAAGVALYKYWDVVVAFLKGAWQGLIAGLAPLKESFSGLAPIMDLIRAAVGWVSDAFATLVGWFKKTETDSATLETAASYGQKFGELMALGIEVATWPLRQLINLIGWVIENIPKLPEAIMGGVDSIKNFLANFSLFDSGKAMLNTLADGIKSAVSVPVDAVKGALSKVREYLPFSDAKVGPLSELTASGTAIMSTLSEGMTKFNAANFGEAFMAIPGKLTGAVDTLMGGSGGGGSAGGSAPVIHLTQQITVSGGGSVYEDAKRGASSGGEELVKQLDRALSRERRLSFG